MSHPKADAEKRLLFQNKIQRYQLTSRPLVYLDESGFAHDMPRTHGYSFKGERSHSVIIMDNAAFHKKASTKQLIDNAGHTLEFLPPYSPDLNPIEHKWAQAKAIRRQHQCSINELFHKYCT